MNKLYIITNSPTSQYRNSGCAYFKQFAEKEGVDVVCVFTESGHEKDPVDGVGAAIKKAIDQAAIATEFMPDVVIRISADIIPILNLHNIIISTYNEDDVIAVKNTIPK